MLDAARQDAVQENSLKTQEKVIVHTQRVRNEVQEGIAQQAPRGEAQQNLQQVLVLVTVGLNWDQKQDEERSRADQQGGPDGLGEEGRGVFLLACLKTQGVTAAAV